MQHGWSISAKFIAFSWGLWAFLFIYLFVLTSPSSSSLSFGWAPESPPPGEEQEARVSDTTSKTGPLGKSGIGDVEEVDLPEGEVGGKIDIPAPSAPNHNNGKTVVIWVYLEKNQLYKDNLQFFLDVGVQERDDTDFVFVLQGNCTIQVPCPSSVPHVTKHVAQPY
jgi:hypothetical protein